MKKDTQTLIDQAHRLLGYVHDKHSVGDFDDLDNSDQEKLQDIIDQFHDLEGVEV
jgi:hypothetical protein